MQEQFVISNRYLVNTVKNSVTDLTSNEEVRLEQRLLHVLKLLCGNAGELVSRERIIAEVWNDYGGADEGLNQAISYLRKVLNDADKKVIQTIPKKGYLLNATIAPVIDPVANAAPLPVKKKRPGLLLILLLSVVALIAVYFLIRTPKPSNPQSPDVLPTQPRGADVLDSQKNDTTSLISPDVLSDSLQQRPIK